MNKIINQYLTPINSTQCHIKVKSTLDVMSMTIYYGDPHDYTKVNETNYQWNKMSQEMSLDQVSQYNHYFSATIENKNKRLRYYYKLTLNNGSIYYGQNGYFDNDQTLGLYHTFFFPYIHDHEIFKPTSWVKDQIWCQIFIDRFRNSQSTQKENIVSWDHLPLSNKHFYGGDLKGITLELDHLQSLGFTALYLTPIFKSPSTHKYDTTDYFEVDEQFGSLDDLKELVQACHQRGMKIILDAVFNHSGYHFKPFQDVLENKEQSKYKDWFHIHQFDPMEYEMFSIVPYMPKLNTHNKEVQEYLLSVLKFYLDEVDIDGWRFDVANELDHSFITRINTEIKEHDPDAYLLAEIWHDPIDFVDYNQFDGIMEYEKSHVFIEYLNQKISVDETIQWLSDINHRTPLNTQLDQFNMIDSHDTARLMTMVQNDPDKAFMALTFQALQKGSICLFYGTHYLLEGENDPYCRVCYPLEPTQQQAHYQETINLILQMRKHHLEEINSFSYTLSTKGESLVLQFETFNITFDPIHKTIDFNKN